jgi:F-type H+-transporting ATPase subunit epsilon
MANHPVDGTEHARNPEKGEHRVRCLVVTPEKTWLDQLVDSVVLPLFDGELGVLPGRSPLIARLGFGELRTKNRETVSRYFIDGGFAQVKDNVVTILTNKALPAVQLDAPKATEELHQAQALKAGTDLENSAKAKNVDRARAKLRVAKSHA